MGMRNVQCLGSGSGRRDGREPGWGQEGDPWVAEGDVGRSVNVDVDDTEDDSGGEPRQSRPTHVLLNPT